jgi:hypothetical protein
MKKLITAAMTLALAAGLASAQTPVVTSDNIVGYVTITNAPGTTYPSYGNCFITVGDLNTESVLGDITADGMDPFGDFIQFLNPADASTTLRATYIDAAFALNELGDPEMQGWWDLDIENRLDSTPLPAGTGFLGNFGSGNPVTIGFPNPVAP